MAELQKAPCLFPGPDSSRCCECPTCQPTSEDEVKDQWISELRGRIESNRSTLKILVSLGNQEATELMRELDDLSVELDEVEADHNLLRKDDD